MECGVWNMECGKWNVEYGMGNPCSSKVLLGATPEAQQGDLKQVWQLRLCCPSQDSFCHWHCEPVEHFLDNLRQGTLLLKSFLFSMGCFRRNRISWNAMFLNEHLVLRSAGISWLV